MTDDNVKWAIEHYSSNPWLNHDVLIDALREVQAWRTNYPQYAIKDNRLDKRLAELKGKSK